jgi:phosphate transport system permease protein
MNAFAPQTALSAVQRGRGSSLRTWRWSDRLVLLAAWGAGLTLCAITAAILIYMGYRGVQYLRPSLLVTRPQENGATGGGFLDPLIGTAVLTVIGVAIAAPLGICCALWIVEYSGRGGRIRRTLARVIESSIEVVAGTPDIAIAVFGLAIFQLHALSFVSFIGEGGGVYGRSFLAAGAMMSLIALPPLFVATRDGLLAVPAHMREAAFALGKTRIATIRRVLLPSVRPNIATGITLGVSRIIADTAIVIVLLGDQLRLASQGGTPGIGLLRGTGSSLTSYVYDNSPAGEGNAPQKAYAAAVVLMLFVLLLNLLVERIGRAHARAGGSVAVTGVA